MEGKNTKRKYDRAFKQETVRLITDVGRSASEVGKELGINVTGVFTSLQLSNYS